MFYRLSVLSSLMFFALFLLWNFFCFCVPYFIHCDPFLFLFVCFVLFMLLVPIICRTLFTFVYVCVFGVGGGGGAVVNVCVCVCVCVRTCVCVCVCV